MTDFLHWLLERCPGVVEESESSFTVTHSNGQYSILWKNAGIPLKESLMPLADLYALYDGMDLLSGSLKVGSLQWVRVRNQVELVPTIDDMAQELQSKQAVFPEPVVPFMYVPGMGYYAVGMLSSKIFAWDVDRRQISALYDGVREVVQEFVQD